MRHITQLANELGMSEVWVRRHLDFVSPKRQVSWKSFDVTSDIYRLCALLTEIGEEFHQPFVHREGIVVQMNDCFAFIFDEKGKRK